MSREISELTGAFTSARFDQVRYRIGDELGEVFGEDTEYEGLTLTVEVADLQDGLAMLRSLSVTPEPFEVSSLEDVAELATAELSALQQAQRRWGAFADALGAALEKSSVDKDAAVGIVAALVQKHDKEAQK